MPTLLTKATNLASSELGLVSATNKVANKVEKVLLGAIQGSASINDATARLGSKDILVDLRSLTDDIVRPLLAALEEAASEAMASVPASMQTSIRFDQSDTRAIAWAERRAGQFIVEISEEVRKEVRNLITRAIREQFTVERLALYIRQIVGLHSRWARAVNNLYERTVEDLLGRGVSLPLAESQATLAAQKYHGKLLRTRAMTIARTEIIAAQNAGRYLGWQQFMLQTGTPPTMLRKRWIIGPDGWAGIRVCDVCVSLGGSEVGVNDLFPNGRLMPPQHPNCRCSAILIFPSEEL
jgi:hypothetical protein